MDLRAKKQDRARNSAISVNKYDDLKMTGVSKHIRLNCSDGTKFNI